ARLVSVGAGLPVSYMFRRVFMVFLGVCRADEEPQHPLHVSPPGMTLPLWIFGIGSIAVGYLGIPHVLSGPAHIPHFFNDWLAPVFGGHGPIEEHAAGSETAKELLLMVISVMVAATGAGLAYLMYYRRSIAPEPVSAPHGGPPVRVAVTQ